MTITPPATLEKALPAEYPGEFLDARAILSDVAAGEPPPGERHWCRGVQERVANRVTTWANSASVGLTEKHNALQSGTSEPG